MLTPNDTLEAPESRDQSREEPARFQSVKVSILGRYMLADRREFPCQIIEMSPGDAQVIAPISGKPGEKIIIYLDYLGRVEGTILELIPGGFLMDLEA